ncbi:MAG: DUF3298 and DUF4163 domain-containing protein [Bacteroidia bacterium]|jgi:hypothetical protein|nr:DUF3298 and DUF4163 domain-containing protein [Bacteroidia bacterium]
MKSYHLGLFAVILMFVPTFFLSVSCSKKSTTYLDTLDYDIEEKFASYKGCKIADSNCTYIYYSYPVFKNSEDTAFYNQLVHATFGAIKGRTYESTQQQFLKDYEQYIRSLQKDEMQQTWFSSTRVEVYSQTNKIITLRLLLNDYTGGAHGMQSDLFSTFNRSTKKEITLKSLFNDSAIKKLSQVAELQFKKHYKLTDSLTLEQAGFWFKDDVFQLNENFAIHNEGITWLYNPYEIAPYAFGSPTITIDKETILPLLQKDFATIWEP